MMILYAESVFREKMSDFPSLSEANGRVICPI